MTRRRTRNFSILLLWILAFAISILCDRWVANAANNSNLPNFLIDSGLAAVFKAPGEYWFTAVLALMACVFYPRRPRWQNGGFVLLCGAISGVNGVIKWLVGRARPFKMLASKQTVDLQPFSLHPMYDSIGAMFTTANLCFPSGHATLAFANAAGMAILFPRWRWAFYAVATLTAVERMLETAHWSSDCVAGAALGIYGVKLLAYYIADPVEPLAPRGFPVVVPSSADTSRV